jgi:hypothetical protein
LSPKNIPGPGRGCIAAGGRDMCVIRPASDPPGVRARLADRSWLPLARLTHNGLSMRPQLARNASCRNATDWREDRSIYDRGRRAVGVRVLCLEIGDGLADDPLSRVLAHPAASGSTLQGLRRMPPGRPSCQGSASWAVVSVTAAGRSGAMDVQVHASPKPAPSCPMCDRAGRHTPEQPFVRA